MNSSRRDFLKKSSAAMLGASSFGLLRPRLLLGQEEGSEAVAFPTLVVIYLRGGADPLNTIVPFRDENYYSIRPTIAIPKPDQELGCLPISNEFGLNPAMKSLHDLYQEGLVAPIVNVGSPHETRSHFDAQDFMEYAAPGVRTITEGWLNRYLTESDVDARAESELRALAMQPLLPRSLRGAFPALAVPEIGADAALNAFESLYLCEDDRDSEESNKMNLREKSKNVLSAGRNTIQILRRFRDIVRNQPEGKGYPDSRLGTQLKNIAKVVKAGTGLEIAALDYNGWDHHARQGSTDGTMFNMLENLSDSIAAFAHDLGPRMNRVLVLTMSEFGRTVRENGNNGSDHGHGGFMLATGGMVRGGKVYGEWTGLENEALYEGRDMPVHTDFRLVFLEVLHRLFRFRHLDGFFPDWKPEARALEFLKQV